MEKSLDISVRYLKGIGPQKAKALNNLGIKTVEDLIYYFPRRYEDRTHFFPIKNLKEGETQTIKAQVLAKGVKESWKKRGFKIVEIAVGDNTGKIFCVWFNQPYLKDYFKVGESVILYGRIERYSGRLQMNSPEFEIVSKEPDGSLNIGRIVPIYSLPTGITQRNFRQIIKYALDKFIPWIKEAMPYEIRSRNNLLNLAKVLINIHFPENWDLQKEAHRRLSFEEFFLFQIPLALRKLKRKEKQGIPHQVTGQLLDNFMTNLPFRFTLAQGKVLEEIKTDMASPRVMQRLLQGDVGSGKTVVATAASIIAIQGGYQAAFMVPTEILAKQHFEKIGSQVTSHPAHPAGRQSPAKEIKIGLLTSSLNKKEKERVYQEISEGKIDLVIGTHALLEEGISFKNLGLVVIDEQHKFGVAQRALLPKKGVNPDVLIMTATPIPRTLAITLYADLDISVINELPPGRLAIKTMHFSEKEQEKAHQIAKAQFPAKNQVYIIYPVIEESYALDIMGAKKMYARLKAGEFKEFRLGLIHGRMKQQEQDEAMRQFKNKELDLLVATTVLEVGIDMPSATCMIIEHAERFGLSQLHQLRGRIGRSDIESVCLLISDPQTQEARARLAAMVKYSDGFRIAEEDLKIRGPGEFFGQRQHGLSELRIANPLTQLQLLKRAREEAVRLISTDSHLAMQSHLALKEKLLQRFPEYEKLILVG
jgi:ATP-dependent DNA helicase RecG